MSSIIIETQFSIFLSSLSNAVASLQWMETTACFASLSFYCMTVFVCTRAHPYCRHHLLPLRSCCVSCVVSTLECRDNIIHSNEQSCRHCLVSPLSRQITVNVGILKTVMSEVTLQKHIYEILLIQADISNNNLKFKARSFSTSASELFYPSMIKFFPSSLYRRSVASLWYTNQSF